MNIRQQIVDWLHTKPFWQQCAADIILRNNAITPDVIAQLKELVKSARGQSTDSRVDFSFFHGYSENNDFAKINSISDVEGIDNISSYRPLKFGPNMTVVYGHNGSGKSGYTRILKKLCGHPSASELRPNIYQPLPAVSKCKVSLAHEGKNHELEWQANENPIKLLEAVDIFDAVSGQFYLEQENEVSYVPLDVSFFEQLAALFDSVKDALESEKKQLNSNLPTKPSQYSETKHVQAMYGRLHKDADEQKLEDFFTFTDEDEKLKGDLEQRLNTDPKKLVTSKNNLIKQLEVTLTKIKKAAELVNTQSCSSFVSLYQDKELKRKVASEGAQAVIDGSDIKGVGTATWKALWLAAREFSTAEAYKSDEFPYVDDDAKCVLCHQNLTAEAKLRFQSFESFIKGALEKEAALSDKAFSDVVALLPKEPKAEELTTQLSAAGLNEEKWLPIFRQTWSLITKRSEALIKRPNENLEPFEYDSNIFNDLYTLVDKLKAEVVQHEEDARNFNSIAVQSELVSLKAKLWSSSYLPQIKQEVIRLQKIENYDLWIKLTSTIAVTRKGNEVAAKMITESYVSRFNDELSLLGASQIKVELVKGKGGKGKVKHKLQLSGVTPQYSRKKTSEILSDGEQRVVSLAAFFADVTGKPHMAPFVFDDPISSLDVDYEWEVARRLVELSDSRQVLVFSHRLSLLGALEELSKKAWSDNDRKVKFSQVCIESFNGKHGCVAEMDGFSVNTKAANNKLISSLGETKSAFEKHQDQAVFKLQIQGICSEFRKLVERTVEDDLLDQIVRRHRRGIQTDNRLIKLPRIGLADCQFLDGLMSKYSCYEHSHSREAPKFLPSFDELNKDLEMLKKWRETFKKRLVHMN